MELMFNNQDEINYLDSFLGPDKDVLEWGSGGSTYHIANKVKSMVSIEHDEKWYKDVCEACGVGTFFKNIPGLDYYHVPRNKEEAPGHDGTLEDYFDYVKFPVKLRKKYDLIFIDGRARAECAAVAVDLLKPGGTILIHDMFHPQEQYRRYEYETVLSYLDHTGGAFALHSFKPKQNYIPMLELTEEAANMCWYQDYCIEEMNRFHDMHVKGHDLAEHMKGFTNLLAAVEIGADGNNKMIDLGCGTAMISQHVKGFHYYGSDLKKMIFGCAMRNYPEYFYRACDIVTEDISWIKNTNYKVVVVNGVIDIMHNALSVLTKVLEHTPEYLIIHRQEITEAGPTSEKVNGSYGGNTYHSIFNRAEFMALLDEMNFEVVKEERLNFANWENGGSSFLLKKRTSWALHNIDHQLYSKYFKGKSNGTFLEAGANDGITQSNTKYFEFYKGWQGILIEPVQELCNKCIDTRNINNIFCCAALVNDDYMDKTIEIVYTPECNGLLTVINNDDAPELLKRIGTQERFVRSVPAKTLNTILRNYWNDENTIDLAVIDVEGYEANALMGVDFNRWKIDYLLVEQLSEKSLVPEILKPFYKLVEVLGEHDYLYQRIY